jgi:hypothetical protein
VPAFWDKENSPAEAGERDFGSLFDSADYGSEQSHWSKESSDESGWSSSACCPLPANAF